jgi:Mg2+ and Co2+ transporter CorA
MVVKLSRELDLAPEQKERLGRILEESRERIMALSRSMKPKYRQIKLETREQIRAILSAEQAERFNKMTQEWDDQRRKRSDRRQGRHSRQGQEPSG